MKQHTFRYFGTIDSERALYGTSTERITDALNDRFGVTPIRIKMVAKKLTRFHTYRHFIASFDGAGHHTIQKLIDQLPLVNENGVDRREVLNHNIRVIIDQAPLKVITNDYINEGEDDGDEITSTTPRVVRAGDPIRVR